jgi:hypothetical protein
LDGDGGDAGGGEEAVRGEDHEVGGDASSGGRIEAGDGEDGLHGPWRGKTGKIWIYLKKVTFPEPGPITGGIEQYWVEKGDFLVTFADRRCLISISQKGCVDQVYFPANCFWMFDLGRPRKDNNRRSV